MEKHNFKIATSDGAKEVTGYVFCAGGTKWGVDKRPSGWWITELVTGKALITHAKTRKEAINQYVAMPRETKVQISQIVKAYCEKAGDLNPDVTPKDVLLSTKWGK